MKAHYLQFCKPGIVALMGLLLFSSCKKDKDNRPSAPNYLISAVYNQGQPLDSFVYNSNQQLDRLYYGYNSPAYDNYVQFEYNSNGKCVRVKYYETAGTALVQKDTLVYNNNDFTVYTEDDDDPFEIENGRPYKVGNDGVLLAGSKDTVTTLTDRKRVNYLETIYGGGNATSIKIVDYLAIPTSNYVSSRTTTLTYTYDNKPNAFQWITKHNPYAGYLINNVLFEAPIFAGGKNNLTGFKYQQVTDSFTDEENYTAVNTYDPVSGFMATQVISLNDNDQIALGFHYMPAE